MKLLNSSKCSFTSSNNSFAVLNTPWYFRFPWIIFRNKLPNDVPNNMPRNLSFYSFPLFFTFLLTPFTSNPILQEFYCFHDIFIFLVWDYQRSRPQSKNVFLNSCIFCWRCFVSANGAKMLLSNGVSTLFITGKPTDINSIRNLRIPPFWLLIFLVILFNEIPLF